MGLSAEWGTPPPKAAFWGDSTCVACLRCNKMKPSMFRAHLLADIPKSGWCKVRDTPNLVFLGSGKPRIPHDVVKKLPSQRKARCLGLDAGPSGGASEDHGGDGPGPKIGRSLASPDGSWTYGSRDLHLPKSRFFFPLLVVKGIYHCPK